VHTAAEGGGEETSEVFCLVTGLLDVEEYPALDLACAYPERWGCETVIGTTRRRWAKGSPSCAPGTRERRPGNVGAVRRLPGNLPAHRRRRERRRHPARAGQLPARLQAAAAMVAAFPLAGPRARHVPAEDPHARIRGPRPPGPGQPRKTKKAGDFPARKPGEPSVTRRIEFHLLYPWQIT
jgi:hypothetical protein